MEEGVAILQGRPWGGSKRHVIRMWRMLHGLHGLLDGPIPLDVARAAWEREPLDEVTRVRRDQLHPAAWEKALRAMFRDSLEALWLDESWIGVDLWGGERGGSLGDWTAKGRIEL